MNLTFAIDAIELIDKFSQQQLGALRQINLGMLTIVYDEGHYRTIH